MDDLQSSDAQNIMSNISRGLAKHHVYFLPALRVVQFRFVGQYSSLHSSWATE